MTLARAAVKETSNLRDRRKKGEVIVCVCVGGGGGGGGAQNKFYSLPFPLLPYFFDDCPVGFIQLSPVLAPLSMARNAGRAFCDIERGTRTGLYTIDCKQ